MLKRFLKKFLFYTILICISGFLFLNWLIPRMIVQIETPLLGKTIEPPKKTFESEIKGETIHWYSKDSLKLEGFISQQIDSSKPTIILLHGIRSRKEYFIPFAKELILKGFQIVAIDHRAHGNSEGEFCSFGYHEKQDISLLIDELEKRGCRKIGVFGQSLGGAIGLQSMGFDSRIQFGIIESTFYNFKEVTTNYFCRLTKISPRSKLATQLFPYFVEKAGSLAKFPIDSCNPSDYAKNINAPVLLVHGKKDQRIPVYHAHKNYNSLDSTKTKFIKIENANHVNVHQTGGFPYFLKMLEFLETLD